ncbi:hypothetical protein TCE0_011f00659 [Talaromyces pinophilus]|uniref:Uncharacterized protein n=1 Tax=Talaromyces pinophilus TaxID=128442 RepID=A0A0B8MXL1_TALPI|nr:hypothetical protein TCE0_011f00659 [Talaromyces pinophilus]
MGAAFSESMPSGMCTKELWSQTAPEEKESVSHFDVSEPDAVAGLKGGHAAFDLFDDADAFMSKSNWCMDAVLVRTADA